MSKAKVSHRLVCPARVVEKKPIEGGFETNHLICNFSVDLVKTEALEAQGQLLLHLRDNHNFYWKRHGKKLVTRYSKQYAMRNE